MKIVAGLVALLLAWTAGVCASVQAPATVSAKSSAPAAAGPMKIIIKMDTKELTATLDDSATARAFAQLLPLDLTLEDYASAEKIGYLPKKLATEDSPADAPGSAGEIAYYAPWGNVAFFYCDFRYSRDLVKLGKLDSGVEQFRRAGGMKIRIELADDR